MAFNKDSLKILQGRTYSNYLSLYKPTDKSPRYNILYVLANIDAGLFHLLQGDLVFLAKQLFPDTAEGEYLRAHWASRVPPLYAVAAIGKVLVSGNAGVSVPAGCVFRSSTGKRYFTEKAFIIGSDGKVLADVKAEAAGAESNLEAGSTITISSAIPTGVDSNAVIGDAGILGGSDAESDEEYLSRVLVTLRNPSRYGQRGDFAAWSLDSTPEVSKAWEFKNFGVFGALLIQVINGNQINGVFPVDNLAAVRNYISTVSPPVIFDVRTPALMPLNPEITLPPQENTQENRETAELRLKTYLEQVALPGGAITTGALRTAIIDGVSITAAAVKLNGDVTGIIPTTILQYPVLGTISWE